MSEKIGFVGVGRMGANMARHLKETGFEVSTIYETRTKAAEELAVELGCVAVKHPAGVTEAADIIITVVTDDAAMEEIFARSRKTDL